MKKIIYSFLVYCGLTGFTMQQRGQENKMEPFRWLIGTWTLKNNEGTLFETWRPRDDSTFDGETTLLKISTETVQLEKMQLRFRYNSYYYVSMARGQSEDKTVSFKIASYDKKGFTAENVVYDFPKRIIYTLVKKDSLHARVDGGPSQPGKNSDYYYSRIKK